MIMQLCKTKDIYVLLCVSCMLLVSLQVCLEPGKTIDIKQGHTKSNSFLYSRFHMMI